MHKKRFHSPAIPTLTVLAVLGLVGPVVAGEQVPFEGRLKGDVTRTLDTLVVLVGVDATGNATGLGRFTLDIPHVVAPATRTAVGLYQFTAANRDAVYAEFTGLATPTDVPGVLYIEETATITGGTGRFAGAAGNFKTERWFETVAGTTVGSFEGPSPRPDPEARAAAKGTGEPPGRFRRLSMSRSHLSP